MALIQSPPEPVPGDPWSDAAFETFEILKSARDAHGRRLEPVEEPDAGLTSDSSYANFYVCNGGVIASRLGDPEADANAEALLADLFPEREVVMMDTHRLGEFGGGVHCATQQQPAA